ncbi:receptor-like protein 7 [Quercus lobata]|uniref:Verticillium wilt resistance-like protein n=1 Tax=Quercus lobata TaxID=97700 RepID=A0A7N2M5U4_QUELO|nr:receptor-like protein 7 [Quercus lobata]
MRIPLLSRLLPIFICSLTLIFAVSGQCLRDQRSYLLELKNSFFFGTDFSNKVLPWNESVDCCSWEGVTCSEGRVVGLNLDNQPIYGKLDSSSSLFRLHYLQHLSLAYNDFRDSCIPPEFGNLTNLIYLNLSRTSFTGQIPIEISRLTRLVTLDLSDISNEEYQNLEGPNLVTLVQNLTRLTELYLDFVKISSQGNDWCQALSSSLPNLRVLSMSCCDLRGPLDSSLRKLQSLSIVNLWGNDFSAPIPEFFADFRNLTFFDLSYCGLNGQFPKKIFQVPTLQTVDLSSNELLQGSLPEFYPNGSLQSLQLSGSKFSGTLPDSIGNLKRLSEIYLTGCNFNGSIPNSLSNLTPLVYLDMSSNYFTGSIPNSLSNLTQLVYLDMSSNYFTGSIPSFSMAKNLIMINLSYNHLTGQITEGSIPASLFSLPSLRTLLVGNNHFSGQLHEFSNVSSFLLEELDLSSNNLEGPIPMSIFELQGLQDLTLSSNNFNGSLQLNVIQQLRNLTYLDLSNNNLLIEYNGTNSSLSSFPQIMRLNLASNKLKTFPEFLRHQANLERLDLSDNQIHGEIPNWFWKIPMPFYVNLSCNYLEGPLHNLSSTNFLDLSSNQLQGQLQTPLPYCYYLDLSRNNFYSVLPELDIEWSINSVSAFLSLSSNKFHGQIPESICNAAALGVLDLSNNSINGTIPQCLLSSTSNTLKVLNLRRNKLTGKISDTFPSNCSLQTLNVNTNLLEGVVPKSLANCTNLEVLDIGNNKIHDSFPCHLKGMSNLHVLVLHSNKFYGSVGCGGSNVTWPILQIVDLASNNFSGRLSIKSLANSKLMMADNEAQSGLNYLQFDPREYVEGSYYYQDVITVTIKGQIIESVKILTIFTSIDLSSNNFEGPIPEEIGVLKSLHILNLSHNCFTGRIPLSLGNLSQLESLDLSSNKLSGEIPVQLADSLTFLAVLNLSFNQLVGPIPYIKQFATFSETSYEGNKGLYGCPLKRNCTSAEPRSPPPTFEDSNSNSRPLIDWNFLSVELGFVFGFGMVIWPIMFCKRWRIRYCKHVDDILFRIFPQLYLGGKQYRGIRAHGNAGLRH